MDLHDWEAVLVIVGSIATIGGILARVVHVSMKTAVREIMRPEVHKIHERIDNHMDVEETELKVVRENWNWTVMVLVLIANHLNLQLPDRKAAS